MNSATINEEVTHTLRWAESGSKLTYVSIAVGVVVGLVLFRVFFKNLGGFVHCIGFSLGSQPSSAGPAQPGLSLWSRVKLLVGTLAPAGAGYAAYVFLPRWFPSFFQ
jgi:hypothetical protein